MCSDSRVFIVFISFLPSPGNSLWLPFWFHCQRLKSLPAVLGTGRRVHPGAPAHATSNSNPLIVSAPDVLCQNGSWNEKREAGGRSNTFLCLLKRLWNSFQASRRRRARCSPWCHFSFFSSVWSGCQEKENRATDWLIWILSFLFFLTTRINYPLCTV